MAPRLASSFWPVAAASVSIGEAEVSPKGTFGAVEGLVGFGARHPGRTVLKADPAGEPSEEGISTAPCGAKLDGRAPSYCSGGRAAAEGKTGAPFMRSGAEHSGARAARPLSKILWCSLTVMSVGAERSGSPSPAGAPDGTRHRGDSFLRFSSMYRKTRRRLPSDGLVFSSSLLYANSNSGVLYL